VLADNVAAPVDDASVPLSTVIDLIGVQSVAVWAAPRGLDVRVAELAADGDQQPADLLLGTAVREPADVPGLVERAAGSGAVAVLVRLADRSAPEDVALTARRVGVAVLSILPDRGWVDLVAVLQGLLSVTRSRAGTEMDRSSRRLDREHGLVGVANQLAGTLGGSVMIFSPRQELLASSRLSSADDPVRRGAALEQHGPTWFRNRLRELGVYDRLWSGDEVVDIDAIAELGSSRRLAVAVRAGAEILGSIWVAEGDEPLKGDAHAVLAAAVPVVAKHLLGLDDHELASRRLGEELLGRLLLGEVDAGAVGGYFGMAVDSPCVVLACEHDPSAGPDDDVAVGGSTATHMVLEESRRYLSTYRRPALTTVWGARVLVVLTGIADPLSVRRTATDLTAAVSARTGRALRVGVGMIVDHLERLPESRHEAELVVRSLAHRGTTGCAEISDVHATAHLVLVTERTVDHRRARPGPVALLREHDARRGTAYTSTLAAYLDAFGDTTVAARALTVHANTLRYRLDRLQEICGLDLTSHEQRISAALELFADERSGSLGAAHN